MTRLRYVGGWVLAALLGLGLAACSTVSLPPAALVGLKPDTAKVIWSSGLFTANAVAPKGSSVAVFEGTALDGSTEHRAVLQRPSQPTEYLGVLTKQFPGAPLETLLVKVGGDGFVVGWVEPSVVGTLSSVWVIPDESNKAEYMAGAKAGVTNHRVWMFPVYERETAKWKWIAEISVNTRESLQRGATNFNTNGWEWQKEYQPPVSTADLWLVVK